jgi:hypothetical protein
MAALVSAANGDWNTAATWSPAQVPTINDTVTITHTITLLGSCECTTGIVNSPGILQVSTAGNTWLRWKGPGQFRLNTGTSLRCDLSAFPDVTFQIEPLYTGAASDVSHLYHDGGAAINLKGAYRKRVTRVQGAQAVGSSGNRSIVVDDATGWRVGDSLFLVMTEGGTTTNKSDRLTITSVTGGPLNATIVVNLAATPIAYSKLTRAYIANESSNVRMATAGKQCRVLIRTQYIAQPIPTRFEDFEYKADFVGSFSSDGYTFQMNSQYGASNQMGASRGGGVFNSAFAVDFAIVTMTSVESYEPFVRQDNLFTNKMSGTNSGGMLQFSGSNTYSGGTDLRAACFGQPMYYLQAPRAGNAVDCIIAGTANGGTSNIGEGVTFTRLKVWGCHDGFYGYGIGAKFVDSEFDVEFAGISSQRLSFGAHLFWDVVFENCRFASAYLNSVVSSNVSEYTKGTRIFLRNKNQDANIQEAYTQVKSNGPTFKRDTSIKNRGDASTMVLAAGTAFVPTHYVTFTIPAGASYLVKGFVQYDNVAGNANPPRIGVDGANVTMTGTNVSVNVYTCPSGINTWNAFDLTLSHSNSYATTVRLAYDARSSSATEVKAYFDGVPDDPWVQSARHYGYIFDNNAYRTVNPVLTVNEATAIAYTGVTITGSQITVGAGTANTWAKVYAYSQAYYCLNIGSAVLVSSVDGNNFVVPLTTKVSWPAMGADGTLVGGWLLLTTSGVKTYKLSGTKIDFTVAATDYDFATTAFSGTVELVNTSGGNVTVAIPAGVSFINTGPNITVNVPTVTKGLAFTNLVAGSQVKVFTAGTQIELFSDNTSATTETWSLAGGTDSTVDYTVMKAGYLPVRVTGVTVNSAVLTTPIQQSVDRAYSASSGLTFGTTATVNTGTSRFTVTVATTVQNWYSFMIESWIAQSALRNVLFPLSSNGPNSFTLEGWEFSAGVNLLKQDGMRYTNAGVAAMIYAAVYSVDTAAGLQVNYQQVDGSGTTAAQNTGRIDQLIQVYGDAGHGNFDRRGFLALKVQKDGFDEAATDVVATYGNLEDQLYIVGLNPVSNGLATGNPNLANPPTVTIDTTPTVWNSKSFSITITDSAVGNSGVNIMRWIRHNLGLGNTAVGGVAAFNVHDLVQVNGTGFKTVRGPIYGDSGAALKGVRVITNAGGPHPDFNLHTADDGTTYVPPQQVSIVLSNVTAGTRVQIYDTLNSVELHNSTTVYSFTETYSVTRNIRVRLAYASGAAAKNFVEASIGSIGPGSYSLTYLASQTDDVVYNSNGIDGATVSGITITDAVDRLQINIAGGTVSWKTIYAYSVYWLYTSAGIVDDGSIIIAKDTANYVMSLFKIKNTSVVPLKITDGYGIDSVTGSVADILDVTGGSIFPVVDHVVSSIVTVGGVNVITGDMTTILAAIPAAATNAAAVRTNLSTELARIDVAVSSVSSGSAPSAATVAAAVRSELATELARVDVATSSRNATTPPTVAAIATQVRTELATELARVDVATSSRNATTPPTVAAIATQVRTELSTELARVDATISSRNATTPPTAVAVATQVRTELTTELARVDVAVSTRNAIAPTTPPTAVAIATQVRTELATELARVDVATSSRNATTPPTAAATAAAVLAAATAAPIASNTKKVNDVTITGTGTALDPIRPA